MRLMSLRMTTSARMIVIVLIACIALVSGRAAAQVGVDGGGGPSSPAFAGGRARRGSEDEAARLRREAMLARREVERAFVELKRRMLESPEYQDALFELRTARTALRAARASSLAPLRETMHYRELQLEITRFEARIDEARGRATTSSASLARDARELLERRGELSKLESAALRDDEPYNNARYALIDAQGRLSVLWRDFHDSVRHDPRSIAARERLAAVREQIASLSR